jgi:prepilin-type processing-associated H-X9-DG protein
MEGSDTTNADRLFTGYGMNIYPGVAGMNAYIGTTPPDTKASRYFKVTEWTKPTERALVADSPYGWLQASLAPFNSTMKFAPLDRAAGETNIQELRLFVDGARHGPPGVSRLKQYASKYANMLFVDGHGESVTVREAYNAVRYPGENRAGD